MRRTLVASALLVMLVAWLALPYSGLSWLAEASLAGGQPPAPAAPRQPLVAPAAVTFTSTDVPKAIPDGVPFNPFDGTGGVASVLTIPAAQNVTIGDLDVTLSINHTWDEDLVVYLWSYDANRLVTLFAYVGGGGANFTNTTLNDEAVTPIGSGVAPFTGSFRPLDALSFFDNLPAAGTWYLILSDEGPGDTGSLTAWSLSITAPGAGTTPTATATPTPPLTRTPTAPSGPTGTATPTTPPTIPPTVVPGPADAYEPDDTFSAARPITVTASQVQFDPYWCSATVSGQPLAPQLHNFNKPGDQDWVKFNTVAGNMYTVAAYDLGYAADTWLALYRVVGGTPSLLAFNDDYNCLDYGSLVSWVATSNETLYAQVQHYDPAAYADGNEYWLAVFQGPPPPPPPTVVADTYEPDDSYRAARPIAVTETDVWFEPYYCQGLWLGQPLQPQLHNFNRPGDQDWVKFDVVRNTSYSVMAYDLGYAADTWVAVYRLVTTTTGVTLTLLWDEDDSDCLGYGSRVDLWATDSETWYAQVFHYDPQASGEGNNYTLAVFRSEYPPPPAPIAPDAYEPDDGYTAARPISVTISSVTFDPYNCQASLTGQTLQPQYHTFAKPGDQDWVKFDVVAGFRYTLATYGLGWAADTMLGVYRLTNPGGGVTTTLLAANDDYDCLGYGSLLELQATANETWYVRVIHYDDLEAGEGNDYQLVAMRGAAAAPTPTATATVVVSPSPTRAPDTPAHSSPATALALEKGQRAAQHHWFSGRGEQAWFKFRASPGVRYVIRTFETAENLLTLSLTGTLTYTISPRLDTMAFLFDNTVVATGPVTVVNPIAFNDDWGGSYDSLASQLVWRAPANVAPGSEFYVAVVNYDAAAWGNGTDFWIEMETGEPASVATPTGTPATATPTPAGTPAAAPTMAPIRGVIDPARGQSFSGVGLFVNIPARFITETTSVEVKLGARDLPPKQGQVEAISAYAVKALRTDNGERIEEFLKNVQVCLEYTRAQLGGRAESGLRIRYYNLQTQTWVDLPITTWRKLDAADPSKPGVICGGTPHLTDWALWAAAIPIMVAEKAASPYAGLVAGSGAAVEYTVVIRNDAQSADVTGRVTRIEDVLPAGFSYVDGSNQGIGAPTIGKEGSRVKLTWDTGWSLAGQGGLLTFKYRALVGTTAGAALDSEVRLFGNEFDPLTFTLCPLQVSAASTATATATATAGAPTATPGVGTPTATPMAASAVITTSGGRLESNNGAVVVEVPAGVFDRAVRLDFSPQPSLVVPGAGRLLVAFDLTPAETVVLQGTVRVTIHIAPADLVGVDPNALALHRLTASGGLERLPSRWDAATSTLTAEIDHFSTFVVPGAGKLYLPMVVKQFSGGW